MKWITNKMSFSPICFASCWKFYHRNWGSRMRKTFNCYMLGEEYFSRVWLWPSQLLSSGSSWVFGANGTPHTCISFKEFYLYKSSLQYELSSVLLFESCSNSVRALYFVLGWDRMSVLSVFKDFSICIPQPKSDDNKIPLLDTTVSHHN